MAKEALRRFGFLSTFPPRRCGIATYTNDLVTNLKAITGQKFEPIVVAMRSGTDVRYDEPVKFEIRQHVKNDYICAADYLNFSHVDCISLQHEFGLFGGEAGTYLNLLLERVTAPVITTLHTVLEEPEEHYFRSMVDVCRSSHKVIVMNERGVEMLQRIYSVPAQKILLIPHGIPDLPFVDSSYYKHKFDMEGRRTILTFGLLSKNKGVEMMLRAMPKIVEADPKVVYIVLGMTHPEVLKHEGESYRFWLEQMVKELGVEENVYFFNRFVSDEELRNFLCAADVYVTPYMNKEQLTSGTLSFAVGAGKAVVSTPYWAATELLANSQGMIVPFGDSEKLGQAVIEILKNDNHFNLLRRKAYDYGRSRTWSKVAKKYWEQLNSATVNVRTLKKERPAHVEVPEMSLEHLYRISDETGILQHAKYTVPDRCHGYCTDDNSRAMTVVCKHLEQFDDPSAMELFNRYLSFLMHAQREDGSVQNFMTYGRRWFESEPAHDGLGRMLWAFGTAMAIKSLNGYLPLLKDRFDMSIGHIKKQSMRGKAYCIFGLSSYLTQFAGASDIKRELWSACSSLLETYRQNRQNGWEWFEQILSYENAVLPHALFVAKDVLGKDALEAAIKTSDFLIEQTFNGSHFSFVGCKGWYEQGGIKAKFDQQPIEAASTVLMLREAYKATGDKKYMRLCRKAFNWFLGENDLGAVLYDFRTNGCFDGLMASGVNENLGAESSVSYMLAALTMIESVSSTKYLEIQAVKPKAPVAIIEVGRAAMKTAQEPA